MKINMIFRIVFITLIFIIAFSSMVNASDFSPGTYDPGTLKKEEADPVFTIGGKLFGALRNIATVVAILTIAIIGLKFIFGSVDQKAEYKATLLPWLIGAILVVMITSILGIIENLATKIY